MQYTDETAISEVLKSPRAIGALQRAGLTTVGDIRRKAISELGKLTGVGEFTLEQIRGLQVEDVPETPEDITQVEESDEPIQLMSPYPSFGFTLLPAGRFSDGSGRGYTTQRPLTVRFADGRGELTKEQYLTMKYRRDEKAVLGAKQAKEPWRREAVEWLKTRRQHGLGYHVMTD